MLSKQRIICLSVAEHTNNSEADESDVIETEVLPAKKIRTGFSRKYDSSYNQFGFVATNDGGVPTGRQKQIFQVSHTNTSALRASY